MNEWKVGKLKPEDEPGTIVQVEITSMPIQTGREIYGPTCKNPDKKHVHLYAKRREKEVPIGSIPLPDNPSDIHPKSNAAKFVGLYAHAPKVGMKVQVKVTADGFWQLVL